MLGFIAGFDKLRFQDGLFKDEKWEFLKGDIHSSLHHQGACACVEACLQQVHSSVSQHRSATSAANLAEQDDGGQRELLNKKTRV